MNLFIENIGESLLFIGILLLIIELVVLGFSTFILTFISIALMLTGVFVLVGFIEPTMMSIVVHVAIFSSISAVLLWKPLKNFQNTKADNKVSNDFIGMTFVISEPIELNSSIKYRFSGVEWNVVANEPISAGSKVKIIDTSVGKLTVSACD